MGKTRDALKFMVGRAAELALPELAREVDGARNTSRAPRLKSAIVYARLRRAHALGDVAGVDRALAAFWSGGPGDKFHRSFAEERFRVFRETHAVVIDKLAEVLGSSGVKFTRLVEVGCGDGQVLVDSIDRLPSISQGVGIDLNAAVIAQTSPAQSADARLSFVNSEARAWLAAHAHPGTVVLSNGGVLEYFSPENLEEFLRTIAMSSPAAIVLVEPVALGHDLQTQADSFIFGREYSFSHNYRLRLKQAGFDVVFEEETQAFGARLIMMIGIHRPSGH